MNQPEKHEKGNVNVTHTRRVEATSKTLRREEAIITSSESKTDKWHDLTNLPSRLSSIIVHNQIT